MSYKCSKQNQTASNWYASMTDSICFHSFRNLHKFNYLEADEYIVWTKTTYTRKYVQTSVWSVRRHHQCLITILNYIRCMCSCRTDKRTLWVICSLKHAHWQTFNSALWLTEAMRQVLTKVINHFRISSEKIESLNKFETEAMKI